MKVVIVLHSSKITESSCSSDNFVNARKIPALSSLPKNPHTPNMSHPKRRGQKSRVEKSAYRRYTRMQCTAGCRRTHNVWPLRPRSPVTLGSRVQFGIWDCPRFPSRNEIFIPSPRSFTSPRFSIPFLRAFHKFRAVASFRHRAHKSSPKVRAPVIAAINI